MLKLHKVCVNICKETVMGMIDRFFIPDLSLKNLPSQNRQHGRTYRKPAQVIEFRFQTMIKSVFPVVCF